MDDKAFDMLKRLIELTVEDKLITLEGRFNAMLHAIALIVDHLDLAGAMSSEVFRERLNDLIQDGSGRVDPDEVQSLKQISNYLAVFGSNIPAYREDRKKWLFRLLHEHDDEPDEND